MLSRKISVRRAELRGDAVRANQRQVFSVFINAEIRVEIPVRINVGVNRLAVLTQMRPRRKHHPELTGFDDRQ